jgi:Flp pilus assembly protein TadG
MARADGLDSQGGEEAMMRRYLARFRRQGGQIAIVYAGALIALVGAVGLGADVAVMYFNWLSMQKAADAAALAGANDLPEDPDTAKTTAKQYAELNGLTAGEVGDPVVVVPNDGSTSTITVNAARDVPYFFGKVFGLKQQLIQVSATAASPGSPSCIGCTLPGTPANPGTFGSYVGQWGLIPVGLQYTTNWKWDQPISLTQGGTGKNGTYGPGNWGSLALGGQGGNNERSNLANGYSGPVNIGDWVNTEPGQKVGPIDQGMNDRMAAAASMDSSGTFLAHVPNNPRAVIFPLVDWNNPNGRAGVQVMGFAMAWVDSVSGGTISAHFITQVSPNSVINTSAANNGVKSMPILIK